MKPNNQKFNSDAYWIKRHEEFRNSHVSVGLASSSTQENAVLYLLRKRALLKSISNQDFSGKKILDAGCGLGFFSRIYQELGAIVYGCDVSPIAIEGCRKEIPGTFECGRIDQVAELFNGIQFDIVHCFDVLYHIVDDSEWEKSLRAFATVSTPSTHWYITEFGRFYKTGQHVHIRGRDIYEKELSKHQRTIGYERRLHWLQGAFPRVQQRNPELALKAEFMAGIWPLNQLSNSVLWRIAQRV